MHKTKHTEHMDKFKKFNSLTYCKYEGAMPILVSIDPEIVKSVLIKNFDSFPYIMSPEVKVTICPKMLMFRCTFILLS